MKNNTAECVLISPEEYIRLLDELADAQLLAEANQRVAGMDKSKLLSQSDVEQGRSASPLVTMHRHLRWSWNELGNSISSGGRWTIFADWTGASVSRCSRQSKK